MIIVLGHLLSNGRTSFGRNGDVGDMYKLYRYPSGLYGPINPTRAQLPKLVLFPRLSAAWFVSEDPPDL